MAMLYRNLCYSEACYNEVELYLYPYFSFPRVYHLQFLCLLFYDLVRAGWIKITLSKLHVKFFPKALAPSSNNFLKKLADKISLFFYRQSQPTDLSRQSQPTDIYRQSQPTDLSRQSQPTDIYRQSQPSNLCRTSQPSDIYRPSQPSNLCRQSQQTDERVQAPTYHELKPPRREAIQLHQIDIPQKPSIIAPTPIMPYPIQRQYTVPLTPRQECVPPMSSTRQGFLPPSPRPLNTPSLQQITEQNDKWISALALIELSQKG